MLYVYHASTIIAVIYRSYEMHQYIMISIIQYKKACTYIYITVKCVHICKWKQKKEMEIIITDQ